MTLLEPGVWPHKAAALRPEPVAATAPLPRVASADSEGHKWKFTVGGPLRAVLEFGEAYQLGSFSSGLMVFADLADPAPPSPTDPGVTYFGPGVHMLELQPSWSIDKGSRGLQLQSDSTLYLAEGAVVLGVVRAYNVQNVSIRGRGILAAAFLPGSAFPPGAAQCQYCMCGGDHVVEIVNGTDITVEGVTLMHSTSWNLKMQSLQRVHVHGVKVLAWRCWGDGIDVVSSQDVLIEDVFIRSDDDSIAVKGMDPTMDTSDVVIRDSVLWNQRFGNCMEIGFELFNAQIHNISFERNVCLHQSGSIMSIHNGGQAAVHDVRYTDIVAQTLAPSAMGYQAKGCRGNGCLMLFDLSVVFGQYCRVGPPPKGDGCTDPSLRGSIADISMTNIEVQTNGVPYIFSQLAGNSTGHGVSGVTLAGIKLDNQTATTLGDLNTTENSFVSGVRVLPN